MTSYVAYEEGLPCKNPSCKSYGSPHPNCKCYGGALSMAEGGEIKPFCDFNMPHQENCKHYVDMPKREDSVHTVASYLATNGLHGLLKMGDQDLDKYNQSIKRGDKHIDSRLDNVLDNASSEKKDYSKAKDSINDWIEKGGINNDIQQEIYKQNAPEQLAEGGEIKKPEGIGHNPNIADTYPDENMLLNTAKGRMSNYLSSLKPQQNLPKLAFDDAPDNRDKEKSYKRALNMAANPLHILDKVKEGTIESEHVKHFQNLHPEVNDSIQKRLAEKITEHQLNDKKPAFHIRQGLSLLMGTPLSGELSPQHIQAAQATFQVGGKQPEQGQAPTKNKKNTSTLTKSDQSFLTGNQARTAREQKQ